MADQTSEALRKHKSISMTEFRKNPGQYVDDIRRFDASFSLTKAGKPIAELSRGQDGIIDEKGRFIGAIPATARMTKKERNGGY